MEEWQQLLVLSAALTATVLSWDGYLLSISRRPLRSAPRFMIDIGLVFIYMFLLMTSKLLVWWLFIHALIYAIYVVWDFLSIRDWKSTYYVQDIIEPAKQTVTGVYIGGFKGRTGVSAGPIITIAWGLYFWGLLILNDKALSWLHVPGLKVRIVGTTCFVLFGLILYRRDKENPYTMCKRLGWMAALLLASAAYLAWLPTDETLWTWAGPYIGSAFCGP
jgi:hypothetical protein